MHSTLLFSYLISFIPTCAQQQQSSPAHQNPSPMVDTTRPHPRIQEQEIQGKRIPLPIGTLFLPSKLRARRQVPLVVHFHGAPWLIEYHVAHDLPQAALVTVHLGAGSGIYSRTFSDPTVFTTLLSEARGRLRQATRGDAEWSRVTLTSFSAGYGAIRSILQHPQHYARVDAALLADSLHTSYLPEGTPPTLDTSPLEVFVRFATDAVRGQKAMWLAHSEVYPGTFASTTETADYLLDSLRQKRQPVLRHGPLGMQQLSRVATGNFHLAGFAGNSAPDHLDHLYALGAWFKELRPALNR